MEVLLIVGTVVGIILGIIKISDRIKKWRSDRHQHTNNGNEKRASLEDEVLVAMSMTDRPAFITEHSRMPRYLVVAGKEHVDENDDLYRLKYLEAMDALLDKGLIDETGDDVYRLTARGLERARALNPSRFAHLRPAVQHLMRSYEYEREGGTCGQCSYWVRIDVLKSLGVTESDLLYMKKQGLIDHGDAIERNGIEGRAVKRNPRLNAKTVMGLTTEGAEWANKEFGIRPSKRHVQESQPQ